jgi:spectinomycin phosphotransferase
MLEPPAIPESLILAHLWDEYTLRADNLSFLPLGADVNTAVYHLTADAAEYFLKLRKGDFDQISIAVPRFLSEQGLASIIAPLTTRVGRLCGAINDYRMILYPFIAGQNGYERALTPEQWQAFGAALNAIHAADLPPDLRQRIPRETFSAHWRERVRAFQSQVEVVEFADPIAAQLAAFMRVQRPKINQLVNRAEQLAGDLQSRTQPWVLCHADIHPGNLLIPPADSAMLYIVDWDNPLYAPRERDLALVGGTYAWRRVEDVRFFYRGYRGAVAGPRDGEPDSQVEIDPVALRYYRYERIVVDIAEYCQQLLATTDGGDDRAQSYQYFTSTFLPNHEIDLAMRGDHFL